MATITTITQAGYQAALNNAPNINGFCIEIKYADVYVGRTKKGRFDVKGVRVGEQQVRVRATITSQSEAYSYTEVRLIDGISGAEFAIIRDDVGGVLDFVSPDKKSTFTSTIALSTLPNDRVTIVQDDGNSVALAELDTHKNDVNAHADLFTKKMDKTAAETAINKKANKTTALTAGNGLTGGGTLEENRTFALGTPSKITATSTNSAVSNTHTHEIDKASTTTAGIVKLNNTLTSTSQAEALTAAQGKALADQIAAAVSGGLALRGALNTQNLNDLNDVANYGVWQNAMNNNATTDKNYPTAKAGTLFVLPSAYKGQQVYIPFDDKGIYIRDTRSSATPPTWGEWYKIGAGCVAKSGDTMTGALSINTNVWLKMRFGATGGHWQMEFDPQGAASRTMNFNFNDNTGERSFIRFPALEKSANQNVAYQSWVTQQIQAAKPANFGGVNLDTETNACFLINPTATSMPVTGDLGGLIIGNQNDSTQIVTSAGRMWVRGSDANPISRASDWSEWRQLLDSSNGVMLSGDQTIGGTKTFSGSLKTQTTVQFSHSSKKVFGELGMGTGDVYLHNPTAKKYLQLKDNGELAYSNDKILLASMLSNAVNSTSITTVANSAAVKTAYDKAVAAENALKQALPSGVIAYFAGAHQPTGWLKCNGAAVSRTTYAGIFAAIGTTYGAGDGKTTFNLPDLRGEFIRGWDDGRNVDSLRKFGSHQSDALQNITGSIISDGRSNTQLFDAGTVSGAFGVQYAWKQWTYEMSDGGNAITAVDFDASRVARTAHETRPRNVALLAIIKI